MKKIENEHRDYYHDGKRIPSCTEIVGMLNKPELVGWANHMGFKHIDTKEFVANRAKYGTYCHKIAESYFNGNVIVTDNANVDILQKVRAISQQFDKAAIEVLTTELVLEGSEYGGTLDLIAYNRTSDCIIIFDFKTSKAVRKTHWIQLMGYVQLVEEVYNLPIRDIGVILLSEDINSPRVFSIRHVKNCWRERDIFNALKTVWYRMNDDKEDSYIES